MPPLQLCKFDHPVLRKEMQEVTEIDDNLLDLLDGMTESMYEHNGVGLAAPQVGEPIQATVLDCSQNRDGSQILKMLNPEILETSGRQKDTEGCLSLPGIWEELERGEYVKATYLTPDGEQKTIEREGLWARCIQHEVDHLQGTLFIDRLQGKTSRRVRDLFDTLKEWANNPGPRYRKEGQTWEEYTAESSRLININRQHYEQLSLPDLFETFFQELDQPVRFLVLTEKVSYDSAWILPLLARLEDLNNHLELKIFPVREAEDLRKYYLTYSKEAYPTVVGFDEEFQEQFLWGPRPEAGKKLINRSPEELPPKKLKSTLESYYKGEGLQDALSELQELIESRIL